MRKKHYRDLFNGVKTKDSDSSVFNDMQCKTSCVVTKPEITEFVNKLFNAKTASIDNLGAGHLKNSSPRLHFILSMFLDLYCFSPQCVTF